MVDLLAIAFPWAIGWIKPFTSTNFPWIIAFASTNSFKAIAFIGSPWAIPSTSTDFPWAITFTFTTQLVIVFAMATDSAATLQGTIKASMGSLASTQRAIH